MPYIDKIARVHLAIGHRPENVGELNYQITMLLDAYVKRHGLRYETLNGVVGVLDSAKVEFQRRVVAPYEDAKRATNGDVYSQENLS